MRLGALQAHVPQRPMAGMERDDELCSLYGLMG